QPLPVRAEREGNDLVLMPVLFGNRFAIAGPPQPHRVIGINASRCQARPIRAEAEGLQGPRVAAHAGHFVACHPIPQGYGLRVAQGDSLAVRAEGDGERTAQSSDVPARGRVPEVNFISAAVRSDAAAVWAKLHYISL